MYAIGEAARKTGLKIPTIRFYEEEALLTAVPRTASGRRLYSDGDVRRLAFIRHARALGFELDDVRSLLKLADQPDQTCTEADELAQRHLADVDARIAQLRKLKKELTRIAAACAGGKAAQCGVIEALADHHLCAHDHAPPPPVGTRRSARRSAR